MEHAREPSIPVRRRSTLRRSATPNDSHEQAKTSANLSGLNHSYENSSAASSSSSSTSSTSKKSKRSHPDVTLPEILEIPHQIQQINHSDTIEEADESDHNTTIFDESMEVEENQESENTKDPEESEMPIKEKQQVHHHHADEDQLLYTIREEDSIMLNDLSVIDKENASGIINIQESMVSTRHSKLTRENVRLATYEPMVVIEVSKVN